MLQIEVWKDNLNASNYKIALGSGDNSKCPDTAMLRQVMVSETVLCVPSQVGQPL